MKTEERRRIWPAILIETGFIDNDNDNRLFDQAFPDIAAAIADGILTTIEKEAAEPVYYQIQVAAFPDREPAEQLRERLEAEGFPAFIVYQDGYYKVRAGAFLNMDNAARMERRLREYGYNTYMVRETAAY